MYLGFSFYIVWQWFTVNTPIINPRAKTKGYHLILRFFYIFINFIILRVNDISVKRAGFNIKICCIPKNQLLMKWIIISRVYLAVPSNIKPILVSSFSIASLAVLKDFKTFIRLASEVKHFAINPVAPSSSLLQAA